MANYRDQIIESVRSVRTMSAGLPNAKTAFEQRAKSISGITISTPTNAKFYERHTTDLARSSIVQNGVSYSLEMVDDHLNNRTLEFFIAGMIAYHNYKILVDKAESFYDIRNKALSENPTMNIIDVVGEALVAEGQNINSVKLDVAFLQKNSIGTLNHSIVGFENALFYIFGPYHEEDVQIQNFIESVCNNVPEGNRDAIRATIIQSLNNAELRCNAIKNVNEGCRILIDKFSGVSHENYHERMKELYNEEMAKFPEIKQVEQSKKQHLALIETRNRRIAELEALKNTQRTETEIRNEIADKQNRLKIAKADLESHKRALEAIAGQRSMFSESLYKEKCAKYQELIRIAESQVSRYDADIPELEKELLIITNPAATRYEEIKDPEGNVIGRKLVPETITVGGETRQIANISVIDDEINALKAQNTSSEDLITKSDAYLIASYSSILYAMDFKHLGGEVVEALQTLDKLGFLREDLGYNEEQIKQALSIANNIGKLIDQDFFDRDKTLLKFESELEDNIYKVYQRYLPSKDEHGNEIPPKGNIDVLNAEIVKLCSQEMLFGRPNPLYGREKEIFERAGIAYKDVAYLNNINEKAANRYLSTLDPGMKSFAYNQAMHKYLLKKKLIPVKAVKFINIKIELEGEYVPKSPIDRTIIDPPPPEDPKKLDFCQQMVEALKRESEALGGNNTFVNRRNAQGDFFNKHYHEKLNGVINKFKSFIGKPEEFEQYQKDLLTRINNGESLSEEEILMVRFCPNFNPMIKEYANKIAIANESKDPTKIEPLRVKGKMPEGNSIFPHPLNEGLKAAVLSIQLQCPHEAQTDGKIKFLPADPNFRFDTIKMTPKNIQELTDNLGEVGEQLKVILNDPEFQKFKNFMTLEIVDGRIVVTNSTYLGTDGKYYSSNPYDERSLSDKGHGLNNLASIKTGYVTLIEGDTVKRITIDEYRNSNPDEKRLVPISTGEYVKQSEYSRIQQMGLSSAQKANSKNPAPPDGKVVIKPVSFIEYTSETGTPTSGSGSDPT